MLYHLIYVSKTKSKFNDCDFAKLLLQSRQNNDVNKVTGLLLCQSASFIQYIEGSKPNILNLISKIKQDDRHYDVEIISEGEILEPAFKYWSMQYQKFADGELEQMVGCNQIVQNAAAIKRIIKLVKLFSPRPAKLI